MKFTVHFFYTPGSEQSETLRSRLDGLQQTYAFDLVSVNLERDNIQREALRGAETGIRVNGKLYQGLPAQDILESEIRAGVAAFAAEAAQAPVPAGSRSPELQSGDRLSLWLAKYYIHLIVLLIFLYFGLALAAPVLMKVGAILPAKILYKSYSFVCHQISYRSWFLFGEQPFYPRALAGVNGVVIYEDATGMDPHDVFAARDFLGDEILGYKTALCQRDLAMYGAMLLFGVVFMATGRRIRPLPWYLWILIGLVPIGIDGVSQLPDLFGFLPGWVPTRESTPLLRTLTGALFGIATTWFLFPQIEKSMRETVEIVSRRQSIGRVE